MTTRTTRTIANFTTPFWVAALGDEAPAGEYRIDHEWMLLEEGSHQGYLRTGSFLHMPAMNVASLTHQLVLITPHELGLASERPFAS